MWRTARWNIRLAVVEAFAQAYARMDLTAWQWTLGLLGAFLIGLGKGGLPGVGNFTVILYFYAFGGKPSVGVLLPVLIACDAVAVVVYRRDCDWRALWRLFPWILPGLLLGWWIFDGIDRGSFGRLIGWLMLGMTAVFLFRRWQRRQGGVDTVPHHWAFRAASGITAGFATMVANAAGPVAQLYLLAVGLPKVAFIGTGAWLFMIVNWVKVPFFLDLGLIDFSSLEMSLAMAPAGMIGVVLAPRIVRPIPQRGFEALVWTFIFFAGVRMVL